MKKKLVLLSTGVGLVPRLVSIIKDRTDDVEIYNIVDDTIVNSIKNNNNVVPASIFARMADYCRIGQDMGADALLLTCSSISEAIDYARPLVDIPLFKIDEPMIDQAVATAKSKIGVTATLMTTLQPTIRQVEKKIEEAGKDLIVESQLCEGAFEAYLEGNVKKHDDIVFGGIKNLLDSCDVVLLAQATMASAKAQLDEASQVRVLTSPESGIKNVLSYLESV